MLMKKSKMSGLDKDQDPGASKSLKKIHSRNFHLIF
jgi:hypothetical protein